MELKGFTSKNIPRRKFLELSLKGGLLIAATPTLMSQLVSCKVDGSVGAGLSMGKDTLQRVIKKSS